MTSPRSLLALCGPRRCAGRGSARRRAAAARGSAGAKGQRRLGHGARACTRARPDGRAGGGDRRGRPPERARGLTRSTGRQDLAAARRELVERSRRQGLHLQAAKGRQVPRRRGVRRQRRQVQLRARQGAGLDQQGQEGGVRQHQQHRHARSADGDRRPQQRRRQLPVPDGREHRGDPRSEERADDGDQAGRHRPVQVRRVGQGLVDHAGQERPVPRRRQGGDEEGDLPLHQRSGGAGRGAAGRRHRRHAALRRAREPEAVPERSALHGRRSAAPKARRS